MTDDQQDTSSLLGKGSNFNGKLTFFGTVRIEGIIEGDILSDDTLVVAPGGEVRGNIDVGTLIITGGLVKANVTAKKAVEIHPEGRLIGEVTSPVLQIERGAVFRGNCTMPDDENDSVEIIETS
ncbi:MAG: polymer-forming cytoskeletal protein [Deltaproteobacteria bacterium]|nr:polymer-forming cytoskeletal protein [Deltaproteobacteria bacterium]